MSNQIGLTQSQQKIYIIQNVLFLYPC